MKAKEWREVPLKDVCESVVDCVNKTAPVVNYPTPYKMIRTTNVKKGVVDIETVRYVEKDTFEKWTRRSIPQPGDVILTREAPLGEVGMMPANSENIFLGQRLMQYRADPKKLNPHFLLYSMQEDYMQGQIRAAGSGSTVEHMRVGDAENLLIRLPDIDIQKGIAEILSAYDALIENNSRRIAILEIMAQSLYREWFVKFRFPGHENCKFVDSPLGRVPEGWEVKSVSAVVHIDPATKVPKEGEKPFVPMSGLSESLMLIDDIEYRVGNSGSKFRNGDTLFARITPCLQNGKTGFVNFLTEEDPVGFGSTEFIVLRANTVCPEYVYCMARSQVFRENAIKSMSGATGRQRVRNECFNSFLVAEPASEVLNKFSQVAESIFEQVYVLHRKTVNLKAQRDMLLPRLVGGQLEIKE